MNYKALIIFIAVIIVIGVAMIGTLVSCEEGIESALTAPSDKKSDYVDGYEVIRVDGCQYLTRGIGDSRVLAHKGNCDNEVHKK